MANSKNLFNGELVETVWNYIKDTSKWMLTFFYHLLFQFGLYIMLKECWNYIWTLKCRKIWLSNLLSIKCFYNPLFFFPLSHSFWKWVCGAGWNFCLSLPYEWWLLRWTLNWIHKEFWQAETTFLLYYFVDNYWLNLSLS